MDPLYPEIRVKLHGEDGNAFTILGKVRKAMTHAEISGDKIEQFITEATDGDYNHLLRTVSKYVTVI